jgi:hypothetical protein
MRHSYAVVFLMLLFGLSLRARGEDAAHPVPGNAKCSVAAEKGWTPQEKLVWNRVCIGAIADLNSEPGYGGDLDPTRPGGLPKNRILRSTFLETILVGNKYRHALTRFGVRINGARFTETIDLSGADLAHDLILFRSLFERGANLVRLKSTHTIALHASKVIGTLEMDSIEIDQHLFIDEAECGNVMLRGAHVGRQIDLRGSKVTGILEMRSLQVGHDLLMRDKAEFGLVLLRGAHVGGLIDLRGGSKVTGTLIMDLLRVDQGLLMYKGEFGNVRLLGAHVGGEIALIGSKVTGKLICEHSRSTRIC